MRTPVAPREAAAVVLARDAAGGIEVLLVQRHGASRFAPGAFAFPGGRVEAEDATPETASRCRGLTPGDAAAALPDVRPPGRAIGFWIAALREAFEETGLLLAYDRSGAPFEPGRLAAGWLDARRARCHGDAAAFGALLAEGGLALATDRLAYYAHWITPEERPLRYDTRFFVGAAFPDASPEADGTEIVATEWLAPEAALAGHGAGEMTLPFPTRTLLGSIAPHPTVEALLRAARAQREVPAIRPRMIVEDGRERAILPGDPGYY